MIQLGLFIVLASTLSLMGPLSSSLPASQATIVLEDGGSNGEERTLSFKYNQYLLLRHKEEVIVLFAVPNPKFGKSGITYQWFRFADGTKTLMKGIDWDQGSDSVTFGTGSTNDGITCRSTFPAYFFGTIKTDSLSFEFSSNDENSGSLMIPEAKGRVEVYSLQFNSFDEIRGSLTPKKWRTLDNASPKTDPKKANKNQPD